MANRKNSNDSNAPHDLVEIPDPPDDALAMIYALSPMLSLPERKYVFWRSMALPHPVCAERAGLDPKKSLRYRKDISYALRDFRDEMNADYDVTMKTILGILMEGVEIARNKQQAKTLIEAAKTIADITGLTAPVKIQQQQHVTRAPVQAPAGPTPLSLRHVPRTELEEQIGKDRVLPPKRLEVTK